MRPTAPLHGPGRPPRSPSQVAMKKYEACSAIVELREHVRSMLDYERDHLDDSLAEPAQIEGLGRILDLRRTDDDLPHGAVSAAS